jgi:hypothetical protein
MVAAVVMLMLWKKGVMVRRRKREVVERERLLKGLRSVGVGWRRSVGRRVGGMGVDMVVVIMMMRRVEEKILMVRLVYGAPLGFIDAVV